jgi:hypothetical protein
VSIIFPQSTGATSNEDWSSGVPPASVPSDPRWPDLAPRQAYVVAKVSTALAWWAARNPAAHLSFVIPTAGAMGAPQTIDVASEPIKVVSTNDQAWRHPIMKGLGFNSTTSADTPPPEQRYDDALRKANGTDWAFTLYVVDDLNDADGMFPDGNFAYTFDLFGPYVVTTWQNDGYGPTEFDAVLSHEMGHVFGALDEYYTGSPDYPSTGAYYSGYLWVKNRNAVVGGTTDYRCIMRGGNEGIQAYDLGLLGCTSTRGQIGWRDANGNGIPDVIDTSASLTLDGPASDGTRATITGSVKENPWARGHKAGTTDGSRDSQAFTHNISLLVPHDVEYRVDGGSWEPVAAVDGAFDEPSEAISFTTPDLVGVDGPYAGAPTRHLVEVEATGADPLNLPITGKMATTSAIAWVGDTSVALSLSRKPATITFGGSVKLTAGASHGGYPIAGLSGMLVKPVPGTQRSAATGAGGKWTGSFSPRFNSTYVATFATSGQFLGPATSPTVRVGVRPVLAVGVGAISASHTVRVTGHFTPQRGGVPVVLQELRNGAWTNLARTTTSARSTFVFVYHATHTGTISLRVRFAGDAKNVAAAKAAPAFVVR